jgi:hypothetical protein
LRHVFAISHWYIWDASVDQAQILICSRPELTPADWRRICDALRYTGRDLTHRSFAVTSERRELLWEEMDRCLELANRLSAQLPDEPMADGSGPEPF